MDKKVSRLRRAKRARCHLKMLGAVRLSVHRTLQHIYAQVIGPEGGKILAQASSHDAVIREKFGKKGGNQAVAAAVGQLVAQRALQSGVSKVGFDRSGFKYHGRVQALAEAARAEGLQF